MVGLNDAMKAYSSFRKKLEEKGLWPPFKKIVKWVILLTIFNALLYPNILIFCGTATEWLIDYPPISDLAINYNLKSPTAIVFEASDCDPPPEIGKQYNLKFFIRNQSGKTIDFKVDTTITPMNQVQDVELLLNGEKKRVGRLSAFDELEGEVNALFTSKGKFEIKVVVKYPGKDWNETVRLVTCSATPASDSSNN